MRLALFLACMPVAATLVLTARDASALERRHYRKGQLIVRYREGVAEGEKDNLRRRHGATRRREFRNLKMEAVAVADGKDPAETAAEMEADPAVEYAEPDYIVRTMTNPADPQFYSQWGLARIGAPAAWDTATGKSDVVVAVIDSGVDYTHPDLKPNMWVNEAEAAGIPGFDDDGNGIVDDIYGLNAVAENGRPLDDNEHGTHVAGIIGAVGNNAVGVSGINWRVGIMACKFMDAEGAGSVSDAIECLQYVRRMKNSGVNIVATNNSWGSSSYSRALRDAIAAQGDILFFTASGNDGADNDATPSYPANYDLPNVISVTATTSSDNLPVDSSTRRIWANTGRRSVHLAAPGASVLSTLPGGRYGARSGTSMASPHAAGAAALISAAKPGIGWMAIRNTILSTGDTISTLSGKTITGRRLNVAAAVSCTDSREFSVLRYPASPRKGEVFILSALSLNCAVPAGPVTATLWGGETVTLQDNGVAPDAFAGDGIFTGSYTASRTSETFSFSSPAGSAVIDPAQTQTAGLRVVGEQLAHAYAGKPYTATLPAPDGTAPFSWRLASGTLPQGVELHSTGVLAGSPSETGLFSFSVDVRDARGATGSADFSLSIDGPTPDLVVTAVRAPARAAAGGEVNVVATVKNKGKAAAPQSVTTLFLSAGTTVEPDDLMLAEAATPPLPPGGRVEIPLMFTLPVQVFPGTYRWTAVIDANDAVEESREDNNVKRGRAVQVSGGEEIFSGAP